MRREVALRAVTAADVEEFFAHRQARAGAPDYGAFVERWRRMMAQPGFSTRTITVGDQVVGYVGHFIRKDLPEVSYELGPQHWGRGYATSALRQWLQQITLRPLYARVFKNNLASARVLEKCGFEVMGEDVFVDAQGHRIEELIFALGETGRERSKATND